MLAVACGRDPAEGDGAARRASFTWSATPLGQGQAGTSDDDRSTSISAVLHCRSVEVAELLGSPMVFGQNFFTRDCSGAGLRNRAGLCHRAGLHDWRRTIAAAALSTTYAMAIIGGGALVPVHLGGHPLDAAVNLPLAVSGRDAIPSFCPPTDRECRCCVYGPK